ncbi:hypothetical protein JK231_00660 [Pantoea sp. JGM49]|jgi:hypothetical protein|uniref:Uncharacterized protein n=1 Tax=Candidatus Pantoea communis TaxID=2608354 RepID=A0ABX0RPN0_9GAMM|nr:MULTISPECIES: hypothetical protein [Enterobacterales]MDF7628267.1 hypothetical protein [Erwiniaceae bacterium L1_55_4]MBK0090481.1 hypothetical protein [Erwinia sp. S59]MBK0125410.1 hypothetical protein [Pantoea sp. S61]MBS0879111.1 hypothetical protein [Pantoea sp. JGM49]MDI9277828.1 hypothetical protein [Pantoea sp. EABMAA-21]
MLNQALSGLRVAAWTTDWDVWISEFSIAIPPSGAVFPYEKQATDKICAPLADDSREVDVSALRHGAIG